MSRRCTNLGCNAHLGGSCYLGEMNSTDCPSWSGNVPQTESETALPNLTGRVPWSGSSLSLAGIADLTPRGRSILVGVLGAHDAGKTTLLSANYLQLLLGKSLAGARFAGSRTLGEWESLAAWTRREDAARPPTFPPHTPRGIRRGSGLLHFALRNDNEAFRDVLLTDAPGEWFTKWAINEDAPDVEGARWIARNADVFMVFADCQRLSAPERGSVRDDLRRLLQRLGNHIACRPMVLVWAKDDHKPSDKIRDAIRRVLYERIPQAVEAAASAKQPESLLETLGVALSLAWSPSNAEQIESPVLLHHPFIRHQPFATFRGSYA